MKLKNKIRIQASREEVWAVLSDVERFSLWLPKCVQVLQEDGSGLTAGSTFLLEREWKGQTRVGDVEVLELISPETLCWRESMRGEPGGVAVERYQLVDRKGDAEVRHEINISGSGIPRWVQLIAQFIHAVGRPVGKSGLMKLKELVETGQVSDDASPAR